MSVPNPTAKVGSVTGSPLIKVVLWLIVAYGLVQTGVDWWNEDEWFLLDFIDQLWTWSLKLSAALK
jgi:hypothetical protein